MKKILTYILISLGFLGCKDTSDANKPEASEIVATVTSNSINVHPQWKYLSDKPVDFFYTKNVAYWIDEKQIQVLAADKSKQYETETFEVDGSEWTYSITNSQDYKGRVCFAEVTFFTCSDGSVVQRTYMSNVVKAPNKGLQIDAAARRD
jgi:hypothetical protein